ncbi:tripartite tricarboxylate transporter substrate binding protein [Pigmentiphaga soli]|uniref:Tripartite tricarboxylate transporter substrate binding protein n=2 Tax=Pigmentiphaga soli TaxID=1007095 RepID=A0ABP8HS72_9BURK
MLERLIFVACAGVFSCAAAAYPDKPIRLVVPSGAGGITDILARLLAKDLSASLGQQVYVDNKPGAGGIVGSQSVATAPPDGYTLLMAFPSHVVNPTLYPKLPYDSVKSFAPVAMVSKVSPVLVARPDLPASSTRELIDYARKNPGRVNYATVGTGSLGHLASELLNQMAGTKMTHVPYKGAPQALTATMAGEVDIYMVSSPSNVVEPYRAGKLKVLGVSQGERLLLLPEVPPLSDTLPGFEVFGWNGILAPAGTPAQIVNTLNREINRILGSAEFLQILRNEGATPAPLSPEQFSKQIAADIGRWGKVLKDANIKPLNY